ncbi:heat-inducible transcription repressor HrcA [Entomoplasma freundtii]|uniref:Heat-inducible transcription repressor HrcA n=1 Tax=Entomoplasma freundtii TaxID=74700 RepID=A0A2K8NS77_9MOLU|nr:heat-inducible transcriptional repressor HrcA [Entomoplasma freundtii]ATZ16406.1 heat-inducible transcription repressor HrcA [Entomoplasma freundtii]TDY56555.1 heat-inducible transcription repressor HrcA [Entomoplasma freundtii]
MLSQRQEKILKAIVKEFIKTVQPVGSKRILELIEMPISSATVRNEASALEEYGFLEKQHTSSGRVPSTKGYRYYVDYLMKNKTVNNADLKKQLENLMDFRTHNIEKIIDQATNIISEMTELTAIVSMKDLVEENVLKKIDLIPLTQTTASVIFILSNGNIHKKVFNLENASLNDLAIAIKLFSDNLLDQKLSYVKQAVTVIQPELQIAVRNYEYILQSFVNTILENDNETKETYGIKYMLEKPEFSNTEKLKAVIQLMENMSPFDWYDIRYSSNKQKNKIATKIGEENDGDFADIGMVGTEFATSNGKKAAITLVGPKRMDYDQATQLVEWLIDLVGLKLGGKHEK